jgi:hypothetical protein
MESFLTSIQFHETLGVKRNHEPVTWGLPFPRGRLKNTGQIEIHDSQKNQYNFFCEPISFWHDGSIKWAHFDFQVSLMPNAVKSLFLYCHENGDKKLQNSNISMSVLSCNADDKEIVVQTGKATFKISKKVFAPFSKAFIGKNTYIDNDITKIELIDTLGDIWKPEIHQWNIESINPYRLVLCFQGSFVRDRKKCSLVFKSRLSFFINRSNIRLDFTIRNPEPANHTGGLWDLGDGGSFFFKSLNLYIGQKQRNFYLANFSEYDDFVKISGITHFTIYQDSSGGDNWYSRNHVTKENNIPLQFQGYIVKRDGKIFSEGSRADPVMLLSDGSAFISVYVRNFWENFPKSIDFQNNILTIGLFPDIRQGDFELQGGEQKTHTIDIFLADNSMDPMSIEYTRSPLIPIISPEWYYNSKACLNPLPVSSYKKDSFYKLYNNMIESAVKGDNTFIKKRESIDEYGWRNFGDIYADHEAVFHQGESPFISHYNNQYDVVMGCITQFFRTGNHIWFTLAKQYADHVSDIDIYHTTKDRYQFNNGMFWHTDHHLEAETSTHRSVSQKHKGKKPGNLLGGGPSYDHCYATGFLYLFFLTGEQKYKESLLDLSKNVVEGMKGPDTLTELCFISTKRMYKALRNSMSKKLYCEEVYGLKEGPGRASGNALNTLMDAYQLTKEKVFMDFADNLITTCVSPYDDIEKRSFDNVEIRWMYTVFFKSLCRYIDIKLEDNILDEPYIYACSSLLHYSNWMCEKEYPYLEKPAILEFPNETWAAQELRKSDVLAYASKLASQETFKETLQKKARFFFEAGICGLQQFETWSLTRPIVLLMRNGTEHLAIRDIHREHSNLYKPFFPDNPGLNGIPKKQKLEFFYEFCNALHRTSLKKEWKWLKNRLDDKFKT